MSTIIFDIETVGEDFEALDETAQQSFLKFAKTDEEIAEAKSRLGLFPVTAQIVTIAMLDAETGQGFVFFQNGTDKKEEFAEGDAAFSACTEKEILQNFWNKIKSCKQFVTFNGRGFDCPFVMLRSAVNKIRPLKNLMPYRFNSDAHIDLADQLSFYGALRPNFSLHLWCRAFGITSPKQDGVCGAHVQELYKAGRHHDIARYCLADVVATKELFLNWKKYLSLEK